MTTPPMFPGFDGLMTLSRREGVDVRPTLLRVLTDLYVQASSHTADEEQQFVELASRLIEQVDDATRAAVRARLAIYPHTPLSIAEKLGLANSTKRATPLARAIGPEHNAAPTASPASSPAVPSMSIQPEDAAQLSDMFFSADSRERTIILDNLATSPLKAPPIIPASRIPQAMQILEMAAFASDIENFTLELGEALILPARVAAQVVNDPGGEPLACALKALGMSGETFQRVLLFLNPKIGASVNTVYRLSRLYDRLNQHAVLVLLAAWRGSATPSTRARHRPMLHDDERHRARAMGTSHREMQRSTTEASTPRQADGKSAAE